MPCECGPSRRATTESSLINYKSLSVVNICLPTCNNESCFLGSVDGPVLVGVADHDVSVDADGCQRHHTGNERQHGNQTKEHTGRLSKSPVPGYQSEHNDRHVHCRHQNVCTCKSQSEHNHRHVHCGHQNVCTCKPHNM